MTSRHRQPARALSMLCFVVASGVATAHADAVPPPPSDCPSGHVGTTSHGGPRCEKEPPDDCPPGWRGVIGGLCMLTPCQKDDGCQPGEACIEHSVCLQPSEDRFYDYGEEPPGSRDRREEEGASVPGPARALFAGPPAPRVERPEPIYRYDATNLCAPQVPCAAPRTCQIEKLCAPRGQRAVAYRGTNIQPVRVARITDDPLTESEGPSSETAAAPPKGGCAACGIGLGAARYAWLSLLLGVGAAVARRRLRSSRAPD